MKRILLVLTLGAALASPSFAQSSGSTNAPPPGDHHERGMGMLTSDEMQELHQAHDAALKADPDLAAEGKDLMAKMEAYHKKVDAAMIKADPKVEPLITKMEAAHQHHGGPGGPPPGE